MSQEGRLVISPKDWDILLNCNVQNWVQLLPTNNVTHIYSS